MSLASLLFSEYRRKVLNLLLLQPETRLHLREIARRTGTQPGTLTRELKRLVETGVLKREQIGPQQLFFANRECPIYSELVSILHKTSSLSDMLAASLAPLAERIDAAFVIGGNGSSGDITLMLIGSASFIEVMPLLHPVHKQLNRQITPQLCTPQAWREMLASNSPFARELLDRPRMYCIGSAESLAALEKAE